MHEQIDRWKTVVLNDRQWMTLQLSTSYSNVPSFRFHHAPPALHSPLSRSNLQPTGNT